MTSFALRDYQREAITALLSNSHEINRSLLVLPTGSGKTIVFASYLDQFLLSGKRALVLAHREELLTQARDKIAVAAPSLHVEIEQADSWASHTCPGDSLFETKDRSVVVGSVASMRGKRLEGWPQDAFAVVIVDEAHHATSESYRDILTHFGCMDGSTRLVGVTATPGRTDGVGLGAVFEEIAYERTIREMIDDGYLVPIRAWQVDTSTDLRQVKTTAGDYNTGQLEDAVNNDLRNYQILSAYERYASGMQAVIFCAGVEHAKAITRSFNDRGVATEAVWGDMGKENRAETLARYQRRETRVLTNYAVLSEGWDAPETQCIILARPTKSELIYTQMIGRGLRIHPNKDHMVAIDMSDVAGGKSLINVSTLVGLPLKFDPKGGDVYKMAEDLEQIDPRLHRLTTDRETLDKIITKVKAGLSVAEIDLFAAIAFDESIKDISKFAWVSLGVDRWRIKCEKGMTYEIHVNTIGNYITQHMESKTIINTTNEKRRAFSAADRYIYNHHTDKMQLLDSSAAWRQTAASEKQIALVRSLAPKMEIPQSLSKGDASMLIDSLMQGKRRRAS